MTIVKMTLKTRGKKTHDVINLVEEFFKMDATVAVVDCGDIPYKNAMSMGNSILHVAATEHKKVTFHTIKGDNREIMIFKG